MSGAPRQTDRDVLFDLPLGRAGSETAVADSPADERARPDLERAEQPPPRTPRETRRQEWVGPDRVTVRDRLMAGLLDLAVAASVLTIVLAVVRWMGVEPRFGAWPAYATFLLAFSFLYFVIPLSFWGQTPGMSWAGIAARWDEDLPLSFGQSTQRWIGAILSLLLLGLPVLFGERTLADRISGTTTVTARGNG